MTLSVVKTLGQLVAGAKRSAVPPTMIGGRGCYQLCVDGIKAWLEPAKKPLSVATIRNLIAEAKKHEVQPTRFDGVDYLTLVFRDGKCWFESTTMDDYEAAKAASPRKGG